VLGQQQGDQLMLRLLDRKDFYQYVEDAADRLFIPTTTAPTIGADVQVDILFQGGPRVSIRGRVIWSRARGDDRMRRGVGVAVDCADRAAVEYLLRFVRDAALERRDRARLRTQLCVVYTCAHGRRVNFTSNLGPGGLFLQASELLELGDETRLVVTAPLQHLPMLEVRGQVVHRSRRGMGIAFRLTGDESHAEVAQFLRQVERSERGLSPSLLEGQPIGR
jgi:Tfp pilus assembly protein PilZ